MAHNISHFAKYSGLKVNLTHHLTNKYMMRMVVREPVDKKHNLHPNVKKRWNQMTQAAVPFAFKMHDDDMVRDLSTGGLRHLNEPLGTVEPLPFQIERTHKNNLPVYTDLKMGGQTKVTVVRKVVGDVELLKTELAKVVSNAPIKEKMGRIEISGLHS